jgi:hypothetical protein
MNCSVVSCLKDAKKAGYCWGHYRTNWLYGDPLFRKPRKPYTRKDKRPRWEAKVERTENHWLWTGSHNLGGYGHLRSGPAPGRLEKAHRLAWEFYRGPLPLGLLVLHRCDIPACVNPDHLFLGTQEDNAMDMVQKGRKRGGFNGIPPPHRSWTLKPVEIRAIRFRASQGETYASLSRAFHVTAATISSVVRRKSWKRVP